MMQVLLLLVGISTSFNFEAIGLVYYGEIAMAILGPWIVLHQWRAGTFWSPRLRLALAFLSVTMFGYILADLLNQTELDNVIRGGGRLFFIYTDILFLYAVCWRRPRNLLWFCLGMSIGDISVAQFSARPGYLWKFGYGVPVTLLLVLALACGGKWVRGWLGATALVGLAAVHMLLDFRSFSALCLALAMIFVQTRPPAARARLQFFKIAMVALIGTMAIYYLYRNSGSVYDERHQDSSAYRKSGLLTALTAISESPLVGFGSWAHDPELQWVFQQSISDEGSRLSAQYEAHSQILQAWYEGGLLGTAFLVFLGFELTKANVYLLRRRHPDMLSLVYAFFVFLSSWDLLMSPFAGTLRLRIAITTTIILLLHRERAPIRGRVHSSMVHTGLRLPLRTISAGGR